VSQTKSPRYLEAPPDETSIRIVNGPSPALRTAIGAPNRPVATVTPRDRSRRTTSSTSGSACSGGAASV